MAAPPLRLTSPRRVSPIQRQTQEETRDDAGRFVAGWHSWRWWAGRCIPARDDFPTFFRRVNHYKGLPRCGDDVCCLTTNVRGQLDRRPRTFFCPIVSHEKTTTDDRNNAQTGVRSSIADDCSSRPVDRNSSSSGGCNSMRRRSWVQRRSSNCRRYDDGGGGDDGGLRSRRGLGPSS